MARPRPREAQPRIAVVQHGDFAAAERLIESGQPETYFGMARSVQSLHDLTRGCPHLIVSLDASVYRVTRDGGGILAGQPLPRLPFPTPGTVPQLLRARTINALLREFRPTHVLLRANGLLGTAVLTHCVRHRIHTLVILADFFSRRGLRGAWETDRFVRLLNKPCVARVGNHRTPATQSAIDCGLDAYKAVAYDFAPSRHPNDYACKALDHAGPCRLVYVGNMLRGKGVADVIAAAGLLAGHGLPVELTLAGDGPELETLRRAAGSLPRGVANFVGRVSNDAAFTLMREATLACVPSHHSYPEGMPLTLTEALASRTPVVVSNHPVMHRAFRDGEGLRFFPAGDASAMASTIQSILANRGEYARLSETTAAAYARVECRTLMPDLIAQWRSSF